VTVAQLAEAVVAAGLSPVRPGAVAAAVLVPVFASTSHDEATLVLTRRSPLLQRDPGHVAFPGGRVEPGEEPAEAAVREAHEEVGIDPREVHVRGLVDVVGRRSGEQIAAYLGILAHAPTLVANASEVESVLEVPVASLLADGVAWQERWSAGKAERSVHFFADPSALGDDLVWGVSARILWRLLEVVSGDVWNAGGSRP
jgi:8-oxo-dGTP pyrophosphatase MutT (NUDIX family)